MLRLDAETASRKLPVPLSARFVTYTVVPEFPPVAIAPKPMAPGNAIACVVEKSAALSAKILVERSILISLERVLLNNYNGF